MSKQARDSESEQQKVSEEENEAPQNQEEMMDEEEKSSSISDDEDEGEQAEKKEKPTEKDVKTEKKKEKSPTSNQMTFSLGTGKTVEYDSELITATNLKKIAESLASFSVNDVKSSGVSMLSDIEPKSVTKTPSYKELTFNKSALNAVNLLANFVLNQATENFQRCLHGNHGSTLTPEHIVMFINANYPPEYALVFNEDVASTLEKYKIHKESKNSTVTPASA